MGDVSYKTLITAICGRDDVVFGSVMSGRLQGVVGSETMLGVFINTLPIRLNTAGINVLDFLLNTQKSLRDLLPYEQAPLALTQSCSGLANNTPLFSAMLNYRHSNAIEDGSVNGGSSGNGSMIAFAGQERTNYPFNLSVDDFGVDFELDLQVDSTVDVGCVMAYMQTALAKLVECLTSCPDIPVSALSALVCVSTVVSLASSSM